MQRLEISGAVRPIYGSLGVKRLKYNMAHAPCLLNNYACRPTLRICNTDFPQQQYYAKACVTLRAGQPSRFRDWLRAGRSEDRIPVGARFSVPVPTSPPSLLYNGYRVFPGGKERPGRAAVPSPPSSAVVMEEQSYTSTPSMGRTACTEPQCLYKGALCLYLCYVVIYCVFCLCTSFGCIIDILEYVVTRKSRTLISSSRAESFEACFCRIQNSRSGSQLRPRTFTATADKHTPTLCPLFLVLHSSQPVLASTLLHRQDGGGSFTETIDVTRQN